MESDQDKYIHELALAFAKYIPVLAGTAGIKNTRFLTADIQSVDVDNRTCVVKGILDNEEIVYQDVNLNIEHADGFILIPAIGSTVLIGKMPDGEMYVISPPSDIDKVICFIDGSNKFVFDTNGFIWNGGILGGMVKVIDLVTRLNLAENRINLIATDLLAIATASGATGSTPVTGTSLAGFINTAIANISTPLNLTIRSDIEDTKIKH